MKKLLSLYISLCIFMSLIIVPITAVASTDNILLDESFETSTGGFAGVSRTTVTTAAASSDGMTGNVLDIQSDKSGADYYIQYQKELDSDITSQEFVTLQFDIAAQYRTGSRNIFFGAYDSSDNELFLLNMFEGNTAATISINGETKTIENMKPNGSSALSEANPAGTSYRVTVEFNFFTKKQRIKITQTTDSSNVLLDKVFDIDTAQNLGKLGMPVGKNWTYGKIQVDNLKIMLPNIYTASFNVTDNEQNAVEGAVVTINGAGDSKKTVETTRDGIATVNLVSGTYEYLIYGYSVGCSSITTPVKFTVDNSDTEIPISLIAFNGPTACKLELTSNPDINYIAAPSSGVKEVVYTAVVKDQDDLDMDLEKITWNVTGTDNYEISGNTSGDTCTIKIPSDAKSGNVTVTAASKAYDVITQTKTISIESYEESLMGHWLWLDGTENNNADTWIVFRNKVNIDNKPTQPVFAKIAADSKYWLYINGELVVFEGELKRGPNRNDTYYDSVDISPYLKNGENTICALVWYFGKSGYSHVDSGQGGFLFEAKTDNFSILSNAGWKAKKYKSYGVSSIGTNYRLVEGNIKYDARVEDEMLGWETPDFDDSSWSNAKTYGVEGDAPWNNLIERPIPMWSDSGIKLFDSTDIQTSTISGGVRYTCYLPTTLQTTPYLKVKSADAGKTITITTNNTESQGAAAAQYITKIGEQEYESLGWLSGYILYFDVPDGVEVVELGYRQTGYDSQVEGSFSCNDEFYNKLWEKSLDTLNVTMRDNFMDCPDRERAQWWGDAVIETQMAFYSLDEKAHLLAKKGIHNVIDWSLPDGVIPVVAPCSEHFELPVQSLAGVVGYYTYYLYTGDTSILEYTYPYSVRYLKTFTLGADGVINHKQGSWDWTDWGSNQDNRLITNGWYYMALTNTIKAAEIIGETKDMPELLSLKKSIEENYDKVFWNSEGYYRTKGVNVTDDRGNALAVLSGLASEDKYPMINEVFKTQYNASPYMEKYVLEAIYQMGYENDALNRMKSRYQTMVDSDIPTLWELWTIKGGTTNHAWSGGPLTLLSMYTIGVAPIEAGYEKFRVIPQMGSLTSVDTVVPSVKGNINVSLRKSDNKYTLDVTVPEQSTALIGVPRTDGVCSITANGINIWENGKAISSDDVVYVSNDKNYVYFEAASGNWNFISSSASKTEKDKYTLSIKDAANGTVYVNNEAIITPYSKEFDKDSDVLVSAVANQGYEFKGFSGTYVSSEELKLKMSADTYIETNFQEESVSEYVKLEINSNCNDDVTAEVNGVVTKLPYSGYFKRNSIVTINVAAKYDDEREFVGWKETNKTANEIQWTMSEDTTLTAEFKDISPINLALNKPVSSNNSLNYGTAWNTANLTDGVRDSNGSVKGYSTDIYSSQNISDNPNIIDIDLGENKFINRVILFPRTDTQAVDGLTCNFPVDFTIEVSNDNLSFTTVKTIKGLANPQMERQVFDFDTISARYVRIKTTYLGLSATDEGVANAYRVQLSEIEMYNSESIKLTSDIKDNILTTELVNNKQQPITATIYMAVYNSYGVLVKVSSESVSVNAFAKADVSMPVELEKYQGCTYKAFAWDENNEPLTKNTLGIITGTAE